MGRTIGLENWSIILARRIATLRDISIATAKIIIFLNDVIIVALHLFHVMFAIYLHLLCQFYVGLHVYDSQSKYMQNSRWPYALRLFHCLYVQWTYKQSTVSPHFLWQSVQNNSVPCSCTLVQHFQFGYHHMWIWLKSISMYL